MDPSLQIQFPHTIFGHPNFLLFLKHRVKENVYLFWNFHLITFDQNVINLIEDNECQDNHEIELIKKLLVDPQTCGPLMIACDPDDAEGLVKGSSWHQIGLVDFAQQV